MTYYSALKFFSNYGGVVARSIPDLARDVPSERQLDLAVDWAVTIHEQDVKLAELAKQTVMRYNNERTESFANRLIRQDYGYFYENFLGKVSEEKSSNVLTSLRGCV